MCRKRNPVEKGDPVARFLELMDTAAIDLVVVGRHHKRGFFDDLNAPTVFWSIAAECQSPVLLVTQPVQGAYRRVLVPTAFSSACHRAAVSAHKLAPDATFRICHVDPLQNDGINAEVEKNSASSVRQGIEAKIRRWASELPPALSKVDLVNDRVVSGVQQAIAEFQPDLLAIGARKCDVSRTGLGRYASKLLRDPPTDLLVCRRSSGD